jgi:hypothetical protein
VSWYKVGIEALQTAEESPWAVRLSYASLHGKPAPLLADEARSALSGSEK